MEFRLHGSDIQYNLTSITISQGYGSRIDQRKKEKITERYKTSANQAEGDINMLVLLG